MLVGFETEQSELRATVETLRVEIGDLKNKTANLQSFMNLAERFGEITELTEEIARMFIERIVVHEAVIAEGTKQKKVSQQVDIYLSYIGQFEMTE